MHVRIHSIETDTRGNQCHQVDALTERLKQAEAELAEARRAQDAGTDAVERAKRAEEELRRANARAEELEAAANAKEGEVGDRR